ncbi:endonuclease-reverse transcriptase [Plakobranchus ocellatus]|uniref:Endonuclease-reverse transcriptase n=1 Tax=Plakobranchus ocellatus TaxID=259542 RepID=A0AAV4B7X4_9GAST|nr:endonuclease-reverse transcriptase [Plakobranchus ocellatus]
MMCGGGIEQAVIDSEIRASVSIEKVMKGKHCNRSLRVHKTVLGALERLFSNTDRLAHWLVEHFAIFDALRKININETCVTILENIYRHASARVHIDNLESESCPIHRGVRQGDPISPKLFTAAIEMIFRKADLEHGLNVDGKTLTNLRFADDVALVTEKVENMEEQLNVLNNISLESGLKMHKGKTKYMNNFESNKDITIDKEKN